MRTWRIAPSYRDRLNQIARGRGGKKLIGQKLYVHKEADGMLTYKLWGEVVATHSPYDVITFKHDFKDMVDQTAMRRLEKLCNGAILFCSDKARHKNKKQPIRVYNHYGKKIEDWNVLYGKNSLPYTPGLEIDLNGRILNPEICVDYIRVLDKSAAYKVRKNIDELAAYARTVARLNGVTTGVERRKGPDLLARAMEGFPQLEYHDVLELIRLGMVHTTRKWWYIQRRTLVASRDVAEQEYYRQCVEAGLKHLRKKMYESSKLYSYVRVGEVNESTEEQSCN